MTVNQIVVGKWAIEYLNEQPGKTISELIEAGLTVFDQDLPVEAALHK